jgi:hypothetical protein
MQLSRIKIGRRGNKRFTYNPRFYDERKEDLGNRVERIRSEVTGNYSAEGSRQRIQTAFKNRGRQIIDPKAQQLKTVSRIRVILIALVLGSLAYLAFYTKTIDIIFDCFKQV